MKECYKINGNSYFYCPKCICLQQKVFKRNSNLYKDFDYKVGFGREKYIRKRAIQISNELFRINRENSSLLDIGCGPGFMLDEFRNKFKHVAGIEPSTRLSQYASKKYKLKVYNSLFTLKIAKTIRKKFDVVVLSHIIEHVPDPVDFIKAVSQVLKEKGIIYIETPNIDSWLAKIERSNYTFLTPADHVCLYSSKTVFKLMNFAQLKYSKINSYTYSDDEHIYGIITKLKKRILTFFDLKIFSNKNENEQSSNAKYILKNQKIKDLVVKNIIKPSINFMNKGSYLVCYIQTEV